MKKRMGLLAGAVILAGMLAMPVMALDGTDVIGTWYLNTMSMDGVEINPASMGMEITMEISEDGSVQMLQNEEESGLGTWVIEEEQLLFTDDTDTVTSFTFADDTLTAEEDGMAMVFGREKPEAEVFDPGKVIENPALEDFDGTWNAVTLDVFGMQIPAAAAELTMTLEIEGGKATLHYDDGSTQLDGTLEGTLENDTLTLVNPEANEDDFYSYFDPNTLTLRLHESGVMSFSDKDFSETEEAAEEETVEEAAEEETESDDTEEEDLEDIDFSFAVYFER